MESKGLEALKEIAIQSVEAIIEKQEPLRTQKINELLETRQFKCIEKELKQAEENEKLLNAFKNALTIEHHDYPMVEPDHNKDTISCFVTELTTIRQNELDKGMRKALREWVLKNAFPKELKALEIIKEKGVNVLILKYSFISEEGVEYYNKHFENKDLHLTEEEYNLLKEVLK